MHVKESPVEVLTIFEQVKSFFIFFSLEKVVLGEGLGILREEAHEEVSPIQKELAHEQCVRS